MRVELALVCLLGACAQTPLTMPAPLPEDCGLSAEDRLELERWEQRKFAPILELDAFDPATLEAVGRSEPHGSDCAQHGRRLELLPAIAVPGLEFNRITYVQDFDWTGPASRFSLMSWERLYGPPTVSQANLFVRVGCYLRAPFVPVRACAACREEYRRWCRSYLTQRAQHVRDYPAARVEEQRSWQLLLDEMSAAMAARD